MAKSDANSNTEGTLLRVPVHTVILYRNGKQVIPEIGKGFKFTQDEVDEVLAANAGALRAPVSETTTELGEAQDASRMAAVTDREPARDTRTPAQKKRDEDHAKAEAAKNTSGKKTSTPKTGGAADSTEEI